MERPQAGTSSQIPQTRLGTAQGSAPPAFGCGRCGQVRTSSGRSCAREWRADVDSSRARRPGCRNKVPCKYHPTIKFGMLTSCDHAREHQVCKGERRRPENLKARNTTGSLDPRARMGVQGLYEVSPPLWPKTEAKGKMAAPETRQNVDGWYPTDVRARARASSCSPKVANCSLGETPR